MVLWSTHCPPVPPYPQDVLDILGVSEVACSGVGRVIGGPCHLGPHKALAREIPLPQPHSQVLSAYMFCVCASLHVG